MFCICWILHILPCKYFAESFGGFYILKFPSNTATNSWTSWKFWVIGLNSGKFLSLYLGPFPCKCRFKSKSFGEFYKLKFPSDTATHFCTSCKFCVIGLNSGKFLSLYLGTFSSKVQALEKHEAYLFLVQDFVYSNESLVEVWLLFTFLRWKETFLHMRWKYAYLNRNWSNTMKFTITVFALNPVNKNRVIIVWKGYYNVIHFSIIGNVYISMYPVSY